MCRNFKKRVSGSRGALLLEVLLTVLVMSIGLTVTSQAFMTHLRAVRTVREYSRAALWMDRQMTGVLRQAAAGQAVQPLDAVPLKRGQARLDEEPLEKTDGAVLTKVRLAVLWGGGRAQRSMELETYVLRRSP